MKKVYKVLLIALIMFTMLACLVTPPPKVVTTSPHVYTIPTMPYGAEPEDWRPPLYVNDAKSAGQLDEGEK